VEFQCYSKPTGKTKINTQSKTLYDFDRRDLKIFSKMHFKILGEFYKSAREEYP